MRLYFPVDLTGNLIMIEKLVLGEIWTGDLPIFDSDAVHCTALFLSGAISEIPYLYTYSRSYWKYCAIVFTATQS